MRALSLFFFLATMVATSQGIPPHSGGAASADHRNVSFSCLSWRLTVETNNVRDWDVVPEVCAEYIGNYMLGGQYSKDSNAAAYNAYQYAKTLKLAGDGKDIWVFDIDETALSNLPYYTRPDVEFGVKVYNSTKKKEWEAEGIAPANHAILFLYNKLVSLGFKIVFLSGKSDSLREVAEKNMKNVGYHTWEKLILKQTSEKGTTSLAYKSKKRTELVAEGYRILGNMGDQWSDLLGDHVGNRIFKYPNPMFYAS